MKPAFQHKGYLGSAEVNVEDNLLVGRLMFIKDVVSYVASSPQELQAAFVEAVEDYLTTCAELGDEPDAPFKGSFNVRTGPERHRSAVLAAASCDTSLNDWVCQAIDEKLQGPANAITNHLTVHVYGTKTSQHVAATGTAHIWANRAVAATATDVIRH